MPVMVLVKATADSEAGRMPSTELLAAMGAFNDELAQAGVLIMGDGLHPSAKARRVTFDGPTRTVTDGPFGPPGELVAGFWLWQVRDMDEALAWAKRCPNPMPPGNSGVPEFPSQLESQVGSTRRAPSEIEIRPLYEAADFGEALTPELAGQLDRLRGPTGP